MKKNINLKLLIISFSVIVSCSKNEDGLPIQPVSKPNTAPQVFTGVDFYVFPPDNAVVLEGAAEDRERDDIKFKWKMIKGSASSIIENSMVYKTKVSNLDLGEYEFELTAEDARGLSGKDTVKFFVSPKPAHEYNAYYISGQCPMGCIFNVKVDITLPTSYKVFVQYRNKLPNWFELVNATNNPSANDNFFWISEGLLGIYTNYEEIELVKIVY